MGRLALSGVVPTMSRRDTDKRISDPPLDTGERGPIPKRVLDQVFQVLWVNSSFFVFSLADYIYIMLNTC